jgi:phosphatidate phosphatase LPIN
LDDLKDDDAEMLQIYVGRGRNYEGRSASGSSGAPVPVPSVVVDDDAESGNGPSLPMSPHSVEGAIGGPIYDDHHRSFRYLMLKYLL